MSQENNWLNLHRDLFPRASQRDYDPKFGLCFVRGADARLWDDTGREYFDLTCGYSVTNFGHAFPPFIAAVTKQLHSVTHLTGDIHPGKIELAAQLLADLGLNEATHKVLFNSGGSRAIETAWKAARAFRPGRLLSIAPSFHGKSIATMPLSTLVSTTEPKATERIKDAAAANDLAKYPHERRPAIEYPYCTACPLGKSYPACELACAESLFGYVEQHHASISAIVVEPALGSRGYVFPPDEYFQRLRELTSRHGILMIADEIQTGLGRCGSLLLSQQQGWTADLVVLGKSLGGGIAAISATVGRSEVLEAIAAGDESETFSATPLACSVALAVLEQLRTGEWMERGRMIGQTLRDACTAMLSGKAIRVEGVGCSCVLEFSGMNEVSSDDARQAADAGARSTASVVAKETAERLIAAGLLPHLTGSARTRIVFLPPFILTDSQLAEICNRLET